LFQREPLNDFLRRWHVTSARPFDLVGTAKAAPIRSPYSYFLAGYELSGAIFLLFEAIAAAHGPINYAHPSALSGRDPCRELGRPLRPASLNQRRKRNCRGEAGPGSSCHSAEAWRSVYGGTLASRHTGTRNAVLVGLPGARFASVGWSMRINTHRSTISKRSDDDGSDDGGSDRVRRQTARTLLK